MTLMRPCKQSTVRGTRMTLADCGTESSSSLQMITTVSAIHAKRRQTHRVDPFGR